MSLVPPLLTGGDEPSSDVVSAVPVAKVTPPQLRQMQISEFCSWLRTQTNKHKRPFQEQAIADYAEPARALDRWMTEQEIDGDFTACDVAVLNTFFSQYRAEHGQGGTNTRQRNLHHIFKWLALRYGHADPMGLAGPGALWTGEVAPVHAVRGVHPGPAGGNWRRPGEELQRGPRPRDHPHVHRGRPPRGAGPAAAR
jgi:hypothetical protein